MKHYLIYLLILTGIFYYSCDNNNVIPDEEELDTIVVVGDIDANTSTLDTIIFPQDRGDSVLFPIDLNLDGVQDFRFYIYYNYSPCLFFSEFRFDCLHDSAKVYTNDTIQSPEILNSGDTLNIDKNWLSTKFSILSVHRSCVDGGGDGIYHKYGNWFNLSDKYIGLLIEKEENPIYGWIKLSVPDDDWIYSLTIHETGYQKAAYNTQKSIGQ